MKQLLRASGVVIGSATLALLLLTGAQQLVAAQEAPAALPGQSALRINEVMSSNATTLVDPQEPDETPDWIEIYNPTASQVSLTNLAVTDDPARPTKHIITQTLTIDPNGYLILYADNDPRQGAAHLDFALSANGEYVGLFSIDGAGNPLKIDEVEFPALPTDLSYARILDGVGSWEIGRPTPGKSNSTNAPWVSAVTTVTVNAETPAPLGPVDITATITDDVGVASARLFYMTATAPFTATPTWTSIAMNLAGGNQYQAQLPAVNGGTLVRYYVEASDANGDSSRFPLPGREYGYLAGYQPPRLLINKIVSKNDLVPDPDEPAERPDWIEIYNPGSAAVSMNELSITNDRSEPLKFRLPSGISVPPGGLITLLIDGDVSQNRPNSSTIWHIGSGNVMDNLSNSNDYIGIYGGEGTAIVDAFDWDNPPKWGAFGRVPIGAAWSAQSVYVCVVEMNAPNVLCDQEIFLPSVTR